MHSHVSELQVQLRAIADHMEVTGQASGEQVLMPFVVGSTRYKLAVTLTPVGLRERADKLKQDERRLKTNPYGKEVDSKAAGSSASSRREVESARAGKLPTIRRTYSAELAQHFLDAGELDNWQEYQRKYGKPSELNKYAQE